LVLGFCDQGFSVGEGAVGFLVFGRKRREAVRVEQ